MRSQAVADCDANRIAGMGSRESSAIGPEAQLLPRLTAKAFSQGLPCTGTTTVYNAQS